MFELTSQNAKLSSVNPRAEMHGTEKVSACDLHFEAKLPNSCLAHFAPDLKSALYRAPDGTDSQGELIDDPEHKPVLRFPKMGAVKWDKEGAGYTLHIPFGVSGRDDINLGDCEVSKFKLDPQDGGTVIVGFRVVAHPDEHAMGRLCGMVQTDVDVTLTPPEAAE